MGLSSYFTASNDIFKFNFLALVQGDHSPDNVKFPDISLTVRDTRHITHIMPVLVLLSVVRVGMQQYMIQNHILNI